MSSPQESRKILFQKRSPWHTGPSCSMSQGAAPKSPSFWVLSRFHPGRPSNSSWSTTPKVQTDGTFSVCGVFEGRLRRTSGIPGLYQISSPPHQKWLYMVNYIWLCMLIHIWGYPWIIHFNGIFPDKPLFWGNCMGCGCMTLYATNRDRGRWSSHKLEWKHESQFEIILMTNKNTWDFFHTTIIWCAFADSK